MGIKMYGLQLGHFGMDLEVLLTGHPNYLLLPNARSRPKVWYECPALAYIIEHPEGRILFETGVSTRWNEEWPEDYLMADWANIKAEQFLEQKLESIGLGPEDFRYVVVGHMHVDHAGGLADHIAQYEKLYEVWEECEQVSDGLVEALSEAQNQDN